jgi:hypothetical protein
MKRKVGAIAIGILLALPAALAGQHMHFESPFMVAVDSKFGYMDATCRMVIPARFAVAFDFIEGLAAVKIGDKWGVHRPERQRCHCSKLCGCISLRGRAG